MPSIFLAMVRDIGPYILPLSDSTHRHCDVTTELFYKIPQLQGISMVSCCFQEHALAGVQCHSPLILHKMLSAALCSSSRWYLNDKTQSVSHHVERKHSGISSSNLVELK